LILGKSTVMLMLHLMKFRLQGKVVRDGNKLPMKWVLVYLSLFFLNHWWTLISYWMMRVVCNCYVLISICFRRRSLMWIRLLSLRQCMLKIRMWVQNISSIYWFNENVVMRFRTFKLNPLMSFGIVPEIWYV